MKKHTLWIALFAFMLCVTYSFGQSNIGLMGVGGKLGYVMPGSDADNAIGFGAIADLGKITPKINLEADVLYWSKGQDAMGYEWKYSNIAICGIAKYYFTPEGEQLRWFAGGGLGLSMGKSSWEYQNPYTGQKEDDSVSDTDLAIILCGGGRYQLSPNLDGVAEFRYLIAGDWDYMVISAGVIYALTK